LSTVGYENFYLETKYLITPPSLEHALTNGTKAICLDIKTPAKGVDNQKKDKLSMVLQGGAKLMPPFLFSA